MSTDGPTVIFGTGGVKQIRAAVDGQGDSRVLAVTTRSTEPTEAFQWVANALGERLAGVFSNTRAHVPLDVAERALAQARSCGARSLVSVGGGSCIDTAKLVCLGLGGPEPLASVIHRVGSAREPVRMEWRPDHVAIPTTLSGAPHTADAGCLFDGEKRIVRNAWLAPRMIVLDGEMLAPSDRLIGRGVMTVAAHAVASLCAPNGNPLSEALALSSLRLLREGTSGLGDDCRDVPSRQALAGAEWLATGALRGRPLGLQHVATHVLGAMSGEPHGVLHGILLPAVIRLYERDEANSPGLRLLRVAFSRAPDADGPVSELIDFVASLRPRFGLPERLSDVGIDRSMLPDAAEQLAAHQGLATHQQPLRGYAEFEAWLQAAW